MRMIPESSARSEVCEAGKRLLHEHLASGTWGNLSLRIDDENMVITPSGKPYEALLPGDMVLVNYRTLAWSGENKPSSELKLHAAVYKERNDINAVIHTHQASASTVATARREVPPILDDMVQLIGPSVRVADYALPNTKKIVRKTLIALKGRNAALMANHGAICIGRDMEEAFVVCQVLEKACRVFIEAEFLGGAKVIGSVEAWIMHKYYLLKYSKLKDRK
jgi:L-fuculose-phosphate aldolase